MKLSEYRTLPIVSKNPALIQYVERTCLGDSVRPEAIIVAEVAAGIIKGIQFPKSGTGAGLRLTGSDCEEIISIVSYTLALRGAFSKGGKVSKRDFTACRKAVRRNDYGLSLHRAKETDLSLVLGFKAEKDAGGERPPLQVAALGAINARHLELTQCLAMAYKVDKDAGNKQAVTKARRAKYILEMAKIESLTGFSGTVELPKSWRDNIRPDSTNQEIERERKRADCARREAKAFFLAYVETGRKALESL
jgi:hypothetical protein